MRRFDLFELPDEARELVRECEIQGTKSLFTRSGRPVAVLLSHDEYLAMSETLAILNDALLYARIESGEEEGRRGRVLLIEDLLEEEPGAGARVE